MLLSEAQDLYLEQLLEMLRVRSFAEFSLSGTPSKIAG